MTLLLANKEIEWPLISQHSHQHALDALFACVSAKHTNRRNVYLSDTDYLIIDGLLAPALRNICDQEVHNKWVLQSQLYWQISQLGWTNLVHVPELSVLFVDFIDLSIKTLFECW